MVIIIQVVLAEDYLPITAHPFMEEEVVIKPREVNRWRSLVIIRAD